MRYICTEIPGLYASCASAIQKSNLITVLYAAKFSPSFCTHLVTALMEDYLRKPNRDCSNPCNYGVKYEGDAIYLCDDAKYAITHRYLSLYRLLVSHIPYVTASDIIVSFNSLTHQDTFGIMEKLWLNKIALSEAELIHLAGYLIQQGIPPSHTPVYMSQPIKEIHDVTNYDRPHGANHTVYNIVLSVNAGLITEYINPLRDTGVLAEEVERTNFFQILDEYISYFNHSDEYASIMPTLYPRVSPLGYSTDEYRIELSE